MRGLSSGRNTRHGRRCGNLHVGNSRDLRNTRDGHVSRACRVSRRGGSGCLHVASRAARKFDVSGILRAERAKSLLTGDALHRGVRVGTGLATVQQQIDRAALRMLRALRPGHHGARHVTPLREQPVLTALAAIRLLDRDLMPRLGANAIDHAGKPGLAACGSSAAIERTTPFVPASVGVAAAAVVPAELADASSALVVAPLASSEFVASSDASSSDVPSLGGFAGGGLGYVGVDRSGEHAGQTTTRRFSAVRGSCVAPSVGHCRRSERD